MTIDELLELPVGGLEGLVKSPEKLQEYFGWTLEITRPEGNKFKELRVKYKKENPTVTGQAKQKLKIAKVSAASQLDSAKEFAMKKARELGIDLKL